MRRLLAIVATLVLAAAALLASATAASAHDHLISTSPADGSTVATAPGSVELTFDLPALALGTTLKVTGPGGVTFSSGKAKLVDNTITQDLEGALPAGAYTVDWRVTSQDGHPVSGTFSFTASAAGTGAVSSSAATTSAHHASSSHSGGASPWPVLAGGLGVFLVIGVVATILLRRRPAADGGAGSAG